MSEGLATLLSSTLYTTAPISTTHIPREGVGKLECICAKHVAVHPEVNKSEHDIHQSRNGKPFTPQTRKKNNMAREGSDGVFVAAAIRRVSS